MSRDVSILPMLRYLESVVLKLSELFWQVDMV